MIGLNLGDGSRKGLAVCLQMVSKTKARNALLLGLSFNRLRADYSPMLLTKSVIFCGHCFPRASMMAMLISVES